mgnify:FL=1
MFILPVSDMYDAAYFPLYAQECIWTCINESAVKHSKAKQNSRPMNRIETIGSASVVYFIIFTSVAMMEGGYALGGRPFASCEQERDSQCLCLVSCFLLNEDKGTKCLIFC